MGLRAESRGVLPLGGRFHEGPPVASPLAGVLHGAPLRVGLPPAESQGAARLRAELPLVAKRLLAESPHAALTHAGRFHAVGMSHAASNREASPRSALFPSGSCPESLPRQGVERLVEPFQAVGPRCQAAAPRDSVAERRGRQTGLASRTKSAARGQALDVLVMYRRFRAPFVLECHAGEFAPVRRVVVQTRDKSLLVARNLAAAAAPGW